MNYFGDRDFDVGRQMNALIGTYALLATTCTAIFTTSLDAHEFIIKPARLRVESGAKLPFHIMATHFFMLSEEAEPLNTVKAWLVEADKSTLVDLKENQTLKTLDGVVTTSRKGTALLVAHLQE